MSEYLFGAGRARVPSTVGDKIDAVARKHDCVFTYANVPGSGPMYWFATENHGHPFDMWKQDAVWRDLEACGLAEDGKLVLDG